MERKYLAVYSADSPMNNFLNTKYSKIIEFEASNNISRIVLQFNKFELSRRLGVMKS